MKCENQNKPASSDPAHKQNKHSPNSIFVKFIPVEKNKIGTLAAYFSQFGEVSNVSVNSAKNTAVVKFESAANAKEAYMCKKPVMGIPTIQMVYNPGTQFATQQNPEAAKDSQQSPGSLKAPVGSNLTFESEEIKKQREAVQKRRIIKQERKEMINKDNEEILKLVKDLNNDLPEDQQAQIKARITELKASMNKKIKEQEDENKKDNEVKSKGITNNKFVNQKAKHKIIQNKWFEMTLKITDESIKKK